MFESVVITNKKTDKSAKVMAPIEMIDDLAYSQVEELLGLDSLKNANLVFQSDIHGGKGCTIGTTIKFNSLKEAQINPQWVGNDISCLDKDTEVLTKQGWIKISDYKNQEIMQYNKETEKAQFAKPLRYIVEPCEEFYHFKSSKGLDQMVSQEHRMLVYKGYKTKGYNMEVMTAKELTTKPLSKRYYGFQTAFHIDGEGIDMTDDEIRLDIMTAADGHVESYNSNTGDARFVLHLKKKRKIERALLILGRMGITYKITYHHDDTVYIYFSCDAKKFTKRLDKYYLANARQMKIVAEESLKWDGHEGYRSYFSSNNKESADIIQLAFSGSGTRAGWHERDYENKDSTIGSNFNVSPCRNNIVGYSPDYRIVPSLDGKKYCFTTTTGFFVARRNKKIFVTGNCGLTSVRIGKIEDVPMDFDKLDELAQTLNEPAGLSRVKNKGFSTNLWKRIGRVSSGNHFMSVDTMDGYYWITVHNGSLSLGQDVYKRWVEFSENKKTDTYDIIESLKEQDKTKYIQPVLEMLRELDKQESDGTLKSIADLEDYIRDIELCEKYAFENRLIVIQRVLGAIYDINTYDEWEVKDGQLTLLKNILGEQYRDFNLKDLKIMNSPHNYVKLRDNGEVVVHKGACSAEKDEDVLIPINMRDGIVVGKGKGNPEWNYAAPHGAGRMMSRTKAKQNIELDTYLEQTKGVRSISINEKTLDEAPDAYKSMDYILEQIQDTVEVTGIMKPIYNFKVAEDEPHWMATKRKKKEEAQ